MVTIAGFRHAFFYFWIFGAISVLLDLDHFIQVYKDGLEINLENLALHGTRTLHIPILILAGALCIVTGALLLRFCYLSNGQERELNDAHTLTSPEGVVAECPACNEYVGIIPTKRNTEFPCPYCGIMGYIESNRS